MPVDPVSDHLAKLCSLMPEAVLPAGSSCCDFTHDESYMLPIFMCKCLLFKPRGVVHHNNYGFTMTTRIGFSGLRFKYFFEQSATGKEQTPLRLACFMF